MDALRRMLSADPRVAYALLFGSAARGTDHPESDLDIAIGLRPGVQLTAPELGALVASLEHATGRRVDLVLMDEATPALAYRIFRDGSILIEQDHQALAMRKARAILEYLDYQPFESLIARGVLAAAADGR